MKFLLKFTSCQVVTGFKRSLVCDLQRENYHFISNDLAELLHHFHGKSQSSIFEYYGSQNSEIVQEYLSFLESNEFIFWVDESELNLFPEMSIEWDWPSIITNAIIDLDDTFEIDFISVINQLELLNCRYIQLRSMNFLSIDSWEVILNKFEDSKVQGIEIYTKWNNKISNYNVLQKYPRLKTFVLHSALESNILEKKPTGITIATVSDSIINSLSCGVVDWNYFSTNLTLFSEAQKHNTCLNRKISIDVNGEIKNCPSMAKSYGNIKNTTLAEAIEKPGFKDMWFINKDQVAVCKDCEFRYICTDCRAYIENPEDIYSKPLKCGYNPYNAEWEEWSTNPLKQKAIEYYGMQELVKKEK